LVTTAPTALMVKVDMSALPSLAVRTVLTPGSSGLVISSFTLLLELTYLNVVPPMSQDKTPLEVQQVYTTLSLGHAWLGTDVKLM